MSQERCSSWGPSTIKLGKASDLSGGLMGSDTTLQRVKRHRSGAIDSVRNLGILAVVAGHIFEGPFVGATMYSWHVPVFFFLAGYLWTQGRSLWQETTTRARTLLLPYAVWLGLIAVPYVGALVLRGKFDASVLANLILGGSHLGRPYSAFWFVTALFFAALAFRILEYMSVWARWSVPLCGIAAAYAFPDVVAGIPLSAGVAIPCTIFMLAGFQFKNFRPRIGRPVFTGWMLLLGSAILIFTGLSAPLDLKQANFGTPVISILVASAICCGLILIAEQAVPRGSAVGDVAIKLAMTGFMVVLSHSLIIWLLLQVTTSNWLVFLAAVVIPWPIAMALASTPLAPPLLGIKRQLTKSVRSIV